MTSQLVDVYHSGEEDRCRAPFLLVAPGAAKTHFPTQTQGKHWTFWKQIPINLIAVQTAAAIKSIEEQGYFVQ